MDHGDIESGSARVRPARDGDEAALAALWDACGLTRPWNDAAEDIAFARGGPASDVLVAERDGRIVASVMVGHDGHRGAVYYVAADPAMRGQGLGRLIMEAAEAWLRARGVWKLNLMVRRGNEATTGFYAALGYGEDEVVVLSKRLRETPTAVG
ncbi:MAG: GNAT family acetyltransferase [Parvibaculum sp.]